jgi:hypothetical protein
MRGFSQRARARAFLAGADPPPRCGRERHPHRSVDACGRQIVRGSIAVHKPQEGLLPPGPVDLEEVRGQEGEQARTRRESPLMDPEDLGWEDPYEGSPHLLELERSWRERILLAAGAGRAVDT